jgi:transposase
MARHMDAPTIAQALGRTQRSVDAMLFRHGISMAAIRAWTEEEDAVLREQASTLSLRQLAARLDRSYHVVRHRLRDLGVSLKKSGHAHHMAKYPPELRQRYVDLLAAGTPQQTAARMLGVHPATARRWGRPA